MVVQSSEAGLEDVAAWGSSLLHRRCSKQGQGQLDKRAALEHHTGCRQGQRDTRSAAAERRVLASRCEDGVRASMSQSRQAVPLQEKVLPTASARPGLTQSRDHEEDTRTGQQEEPLVVEELVQASVV